MELLNTILNPESHPGAFFGTRGCSPARSERHFLYLLVSQAGDIFKIGISNDIKRRTDQLAQDIDLGRSHQFAGSRAAVRNAEKALHGLYHVYCRPQPQGAGHTEWFAIEILPEVLKFLEERGGSLAIGPREVVRFEFNPDLALQLRVKREAQREAAKAREAEMERTRIVRRERACARNLEAVRRIEEFVARANPIIVNFRGQWAMYVPVESEYWLEELTGPKTDSCHWLLTDDCRTVKVFSGSFRTAKLSHIRVEFGAKVFGMDARFEATSAAKTVRDLLASRIRSREEMGEKLWRVITCLWREGAVFMRRWHRAANEC